MSEPLALSAVVLTRDEEENLPACLDSLAGWVEQIVVVDSGSTDRTLEIARERGAEIYEHEFLDYSAQRNWAQDNAALRHPWVLHIDADERVTPELTASIRDFLSCADGAGVAGAMFPRKTVFMGRWIRHGGHYPVFHTRLFRRELGRCEDRRYDQHFTVRGRVERLGGDLIDILTTDLDRWSTRHIRWAGYEAAELRAGVGAQTTQTPLDGPIRLRRWLRTHVFLRFPPLFRAFAYFGYRYVLRLGFLDGTEGLIFHFLQGCWFRFYVDAKAWEAGVHEPPSPARVSRSTQSRGPRSGREIPGSLS